MTQQESNPTRRGLLALFSGGVAAVVLPTAVNAQQSISAPLVIQKGGVTTTFNGNGAQPPLTVKSLEEILDPNGGVKGTIAAEDIIRPMTQPYYESSILISVPGLLHYIVLHAETTLRRDGTYIMNIDGWMPHRGVLGPPPLRFSLMAQSLTPKQGGGVQLTPTSGNLSQLGLDNARSYVNEFIKMINQDVAKAQKTPTSEIHTVHRADGTTVTGFYNYTNPAIGLNQNVGHFIVQSRIDTNDATNHVDIDGIDAQGRRIQVIDFHMIGFGSNHVRNNILVTERQGNGLITRPVVDPQEMASFAYIIQLAQQAAGGAQAEPNLPKGQRKLLFHPGF